MNTSNDNLAISILPVPLAEKQHSLPLTGREKAVLTGILTDIQNYKETSTRGMTYICKTFLTTPEVDEASGILGKLIK